LFFAIIFLGACYGGLRIDPDNDSIILHENCRTISPQIQAAPIWDEACGTADLIGNSAAPTDRSWIFLVYRGNRDRNNLFVPFRILDGSFHQFLLGYRRLDFGNPYVILCMG